jgi:hypothetical protein
MSTSPSFTPRTIPDAVLITGSSGAELAAGFWALHEQNIMTAKLNNEIFILVIIY